MCKIYHVTFHQKSLDFDCCMRTSILSPRQRWGCFRVNISIAHILGYFFPILKVSFFNFFFEHVVDEFCKTNPRLVLQETSPLKSLGAFCPLRGNFCPLRWNSCPLWRNYRTLWWNHQAIPYIMASHSMDFWYVGVGSL